MSSRASFVVFVSSWLMQCEARDDPGEGVAADRDVQLAVGDRDAEREATFQTRGQRGEQRAIHRVELEFLRAVDFFAGQLLQKLIRVLVRVDDDAGSGLGRLV